eukprot:10260627-Alexandrium_andersonii.AAC.1
MRRAVARLHPRYKGKACLTATIEVSRGLADPAVLQAASTAKAWAKRVYYDHYLVEGMEEAWSWLKGRLAKGRLSAQWARGPAGSTMRVVLRAGWRPESYRRWT